MVAKMLFNIVLGLREEEVDRLYAIAGKLGITIPKLLETLVDLITDDKDDQGKADPFKRWLEDMYATAEPSFLAYLLSISNGDFREFADCLIFLKQKQDEADEVDVLLKRMENQTVDENSMTKLRRICGTFGIDVDGESMDAVKDCLKEEKRNIRADMYIPDLGFEPDNLYSAVDVVQEAFDGYCQTCMKEDADMTEELKKALAWIEANEERFQQIN